MDKTTRGMRIAYRSAVSYDCVSHVLELWSESTHASEEAQEHIIKQWKEGDVDLIISRDNFFKMIKEINKRKEREPI